MNILKRIITRSIVSFSIYNTSFAKDPHTYGTPENPIYSIQKELPMPKKLEEIFLKQNKIYKSSLNFLDIQSTNLSNSPEQKIGNLNSINKLPANYTPLELSKEVFQKITGKNVPKSLNILNVPYFKNNKSGRHDMYSNSIESLENLTPIEKFLTISHELGHVICQYRDTILLISEV